MHGYMNVNKECVCVCVFFFLYISDHHLTCLEKFTLKWINAGHHSEVYLKQVAVVYVSRDSACPKRQVVSATAAFCCKMHFQANWTARAERLQPPLFMTSHPSSVCSSYHIQQPLLLASVSFCRLVLLFQEYRHTRKCSDETMEKPRNRWEVNIIMDLNDKNRISTSLLLAH
jgi:hypothetical protein